MAVIEKTSAEPVSTNYVDFDEFIEHQLRKTRSGIHQTDLLSAGVVLLCLLSGYLLLFALFDQWIIPNGFSQSARTTLLVGVAMLAAGWIGWKIILPWLRSINALYAARQIEQAHPELKGSLLSWVNLRQTGREISPSILAALERRTAHQISHADVEQAVDRKMLMRTSYLLLGLVVVICLYTLISPKKMSTTLWRALLPASAVSAATRTEIRDVKPGNTEVLARDQVEVIAELGGQIPPDAILRFSTADRRFVNEPIKMQRTSDDLPRFQARLTGDGGKGLLSDITYFVEAGDARSASYQIRVNQPPSAEVVELVYDYPRYMGLSSTSQNTSTIEAWEGTTVTVRAKANMPVKKAVIYCSDAQTAVAAAEEYAMTIQDDILTARWQLRFRDDGTFARYYHIQVWNERNQKNPYPTIHRIQIRPDLKPEVTLISPKNDQTVPANARVPIAFVARDPDFLLRRVALRIQHNGELLPFPPPLFAAPPEQAEFKSVYRLDLAQLSAKAGDQLTLWVEAEDNFEPFGKRVKNVGRTPQITLTVTAPAVEEQLKEEQKKQEQQLQENVDQAAPEDQPLPRERQENPPPQGADKQQDPARPMNGNPQQREPMPESPAGDNQNAPMQEGADGAGQQQGNQRQPTEQQNPGQKMPQQGTPQSQQESGMGSEGNQPSGKSGDGEASPGQNSGNSSGSSGQSPQNKTGQGKSSQVSDGATGSSPDGAAPRNDKAADDQALERLLKWNREQQQKQQGAGDSHPMQKDSSDNPGKENDNNSPQSSGKTPMSGEGGRTSSDPSQPSRDQAGKDPSQDSMPAPNRSGQNSSDPSSSQTGNQNSTSNTDSPQQKKGDGTPSQDDMGKSPGMTGSQSQDSSNDKPKSAENGATGKTPPNSDQKQIPRQETVTRDKEMGNQSSSGSSSQQPGKSEQQPGNSSSSSPADSQMSQGQPGSQGESTSSGEKKSSGKESGNPSNDSNSPSGPGEKSATPADSQQGAMPNQGKSSQDNPAGSSQKSSSSQASPGDAQGQQSTENGPGMKSQESGKTGENQSAGRTMDKGSKPTDGTGPKSPAEQAPTPTDPMGVSGKSQQSDRMNSKSDNPGNSGASPQSGENKPAPNGSSSSESPGQSTSPPGKGTRERDAPRQGKDAGAPPNGSSQGDSPMSAGNSPSQEDSNGNKSGGMEKSAQQGGNESAGPKGNDKQQNAEKPSASEGQGESSSMKNAPQSGGEGKQSAGSPDGKNSSSGKEGQGQSDSPQGNSGQQSGSQGGQSPMSNGGEGQSQGKAGSEGGQSGKAGTGNGQQPGQPGGEGSASQTSTGAGGGPINRPAQSTDSTGADPGIEGQITAEQADLANKRKATDLALKRLRSQLERGETPQELMDELGYTQQDLERFMQKLEQRLADPGLDHSPESEAARRQFDSILKGIDYQSSGQKRAAGTHERKASRSAGSENRLAPPQYRRDSEAYKENLSREGTGR